MASDAIIKLGRTRLSQVGIQNTEPYFAVRHRKAMSNMVIPFHYDSSLVVVNVSLNDDYQGGHLLFISDGKVHRPERIAGTATVHD